MIATAFATVASVRMAAPSWPGTPSGFWSPGRASLSSGPGVSIVPTRNSAEQPMANQPAHRQRGPSRWSVGYRRRIHVVAMTIAGRKNSCDTTSAASASGSGAYGPGG